MEVRINKEIRAYKENIFFGLSARQFICSVSAVGVAVGLYFGLEQFAGKEAVSWLCIVGAVPLAAAGFFQYNGLTIERFLLVWLKSAVFGSGRRLYRSENIYYQALFGAKRKRRTKHDKNAKSKSGK